jgi:hypothetical protein
MSHALLAMPVRAPRALIACAERGDDEHRAMLGLKPRLERVDWAGKQAATRRAPAAPAKPAPASKASAAARKARRQ